MQRSERCRLRCVNRRRYRHLRAQVRTAAWPCQRGGRRAARPMHFCSTRCRCAAPRWRLLIFHVYQLWVLQSLPGLLAPVRCNAGTIKCNISHARYQLAEATCLKQRPAHLARVCRRCRQHRRALHAWQAMTEPPPCPASTSGAPPTACPSPRTPSAHHRRQQRRRYSR